MTEQVLSALHELIAVTRNKSNDSWMGFGEVADYIGFSSDHAQTIVRRDDFPRPVRIDGKGHSRWLRSDVTAWMRSHQV